MYERFTDSARKLMQLANQEALRFQHEYIGTEHILLGLILEGRGVGAKVLVGLGCSLLRVRQEVEKIVQAGPDVVAMNKLPQTPRAKRVIEFSIEEARSLRHDYVGTEHLLLGLLREEEGVAAQVLVNLGVTLKKARYETLRILGLAEEDDDENPSPRPAPKATKPTLHNLGTDLTLLAKEGKLGPVVGRGEEIGRLSEILSGWAIRHPVLIGEPGVGKRSVVRGLARHMSGGRLISLNLTELLLQTKHIDLLWETVRPCLREARQAGDVMLFLPTWLSLVAVDGPEEAVGGLFAVLPVCGVRCILAGTAVEWERGLSRFPFLKGVVEPVMIHSPTPEQTVAIGLAQRDRYAAHHQVTITDDAVRLAVEISDRLLSSRSQPGKALDVIDRAAARVRLRWEGTKPDLEEIDTEIERLTSEMEAAVVIQDFDRAAELRDRADKLKQDREAMRQAWLGSSRGIVDEQVVRAVVAAMAGPSPVWEE